MTFIEWCLEDETDDRDLHIITEDGREFLPGVPVPIIELFGLKPLTVVGEPKLVNNIWQIKLK